MTTRVLLVGAREASGRALAARGARVTCVSDATDSATGPPEWAEEEILLDSVTDVAEVVCAAAQTTISAGPFAAICSGSEFPLLSAAVARDALGTAGLDTATAILLRDKFTQKASIRASGILVADFRIVPGQSAPADLHYPAVVKPLSGGGAAQTFRVDGPDEFSEKTRGSRRWLAEKYVDGRELQIDGAVRKGQLVLFTVARYLSNLLPTHQTELVGAIVIPPRDEPDLYRRAAELTVGALAALGFRDGVFHLEAFDMLDGTLIFSECAGRVSGGAADVAIRLSTGRDIHDEWARAVLNLPSVAKTVWREGVFGDVQLTLPPGIVQSLPTKQDLVRRPGVSAARFHTAVGQTMADARASSDIRAVTAVVGAPDVAGVRRRIRELAAWFTTVARSAQR
ncbi:ATP-grasp domain-containing protein [Rathayibacter toxicus]|uniref:ATP-grasp domain-containing protein n=1 Tax=Rathayibacter toxicus TaxID=145458 RepID=UPI000CE86711|nr:hypothetical protein [Rathayibacter toxicus]PPI56040.1 hypothetical protein C5D35_02070 [Rathayibacter toxicus]QOD10170.1 hypothetical protein BSG36_09685 [Rathayibacter toxicus]QWL28846.1 hypothetical protein E2R33_09710 [Rathayibacter toxicus]